MFFFLFGMLRAKQEQTPSRLFFKKKKIKYLRLAVKFKFMTLFVQDQNKTQGRQFNARMRLTENEKRNTNALGGRSIITREN